MNTFQLVCLFLFWLIIVYITTNRSVARRTGLIGSKNRGVYGLQAYPVTKVIDVMSAFLGNISQLNKVKVSRWFKLYYYLYLPNSYRVTTDTIAITDYYIRNLERSEVPPISLEFNVANDIHAILNMVIDYLKVIHVTLIPSEFDEQTQMGVRFILLRELCIKYKVHPIEWMLSEPVVSSLFKNKLTIGYGLSLMLDMVDKELTGYGESQLKNGLAIAIKSYYFTHSNYEPVLATRTLKRSTILRNQRFRQTKLVESFTSEVSFAKPRDFINGFEDDKLLAFDCERYMVLPKLTLDEIDETRVGFFQSIGSDFIDLIERLKTNQVDVDLWFVDYFANHETNYRLLDTRIPSNTNHSIHLNKDKWSDETKDLHIVFSLQMHLHFNKEKFNPLP